MIDYFALALTHGLLAIAVWRMLGRDDLDLEPETDSDIPAECAADTGTDTNSGPKYRDGRPKDGRRS